MGVRLLVTVLLCLLALSSVEASGSRLDSRELTIADIPPCGIQCLLSELPASGCLPTDVECVCGNKPLTYAFSACMLANCTMADSLTSAKVQAELCNLSEESKSHEVILYTSIVYSVAIVSVVLRLVGKAVLHKLAWDDAMVVAALLLTAIPVGCVLDMALKGFGKHLWNLEEGKLLPILRSLYISWSTYVIVLCMIKISLVLFYLEIFKTPRFKITAYILLAYLILNSFIIFFLTIFSCNPVHSFWDRDIKGKCMDIQATAYANSASAILQDIILLVLPLIFIRNLQMKRYRKVAVGFMFCIGTFGCIATIMRIPTLSTFKISIDPTWDYVPVTIWTELELAAGFLCVSLPSIRILLVRLLPQRVKELISNITHQSRSKSKLAPQPAVCAEQRKGQKPFVWTDISANNTYDNTSEDMVPLTLGSGVRKSFMSAFWNRNSTTPSPLWRISRQPAPATSNPSEAGAAVTRPTYHEDGSHSTFVQVEMREVPKSARHSSTPYRSASSDDGHVTALPPVRYSPEQLYSATHPTRDYRASAPQWSPNDRNIV